MRCGLRSAGGPALEAAAPSARPWPCGHYLRRSGRPPAAHQRVVPGFGDPRHEPLERAPVELNAEAGAVAYL
jgi:hypothetical protein